MSMGLCIIQVSDVNLPSNYHLDLNCTQMPTYTKTQQSTKDQMKTQRRYETIAVLWLRWHWILGHDKTSSQIFFIIRMEVIYRFLIFRVKVGRFSDRTLHIDILIYVGKYLVTYKNSVIFYMLLKILKPGQISSWILYPLISFF